MLRQNNKTWFERENELIIIYLIEKKQSKLISIT